MEIDVVIISWAKTPELYEVTKTGIISLVESALPDTQFHIYVIESAPGVNWDDLISKESGHTIRTIQPDTEFGYHKYLNIGVRLGRSPYVALCNSDLTYEPGWAEAIIKAMQENREILSASPWCPQTQGPNELHRGRTYQGYQVRGELAGWCIFQQRRIYDLIKELDERFVFWYCDNDYAEELKAKGIVHALIPDSVVNHHQGNIGATAQNLDKETLEKFTETPRKIFLDKWKLK